jgi:hypothetical protein
MNAVLDLTGIYEHGDGPLGCFLPAHNREEL